MWPIVECPKPVIGVVDGPAVGMGAEFDSQCDIRIASNRARFAWNFSHRGLVPDTGAGSWLLPKLVGTSQALWLLYSGEFISAAEAHELKFISGVFEPEELEDKTKQLTDAILKGSPFSHQRIKALVYEAWVRMSVSTWLTIPRHWQSVLSLKITRKVWRRFLNDVRLASRVIK